MDLFTYLGAKNGKFTLPHKSDLFAYLLGKNSKLPVQTASGTTLEITAKKTNVLELTLDKMCSQEGTPTPDNPIEVNVAEGYRNLFDQEKYLTETFTTGTYKYALANFKGNRTLYVKAQIKSGKTAISDLFVAFTTNGTNPNSGTSHFVIRYNGVNNGSIDFTGTNDIYVSYYPTSYTWEQILDVYDIWVVTSDIAYTESTLLPYVPYGNNYINLNITDGVNSINKQIPLNDNFIGGIGDYKDVLTIDETGSISLVKNIGKVVLNGSENWGTSNSMYYTGNSLVLNTTGITHYSNYFVGGTNRATTGSMYNNNPDNSICSADSGTSSKSLFVKSTMFADTTELKTWLSTHNTEVYYILETPTTINLGTIDISLFKGSNIITNYDNCNMTIKYY